MLEQVQYQKAHRAFTPSNRRAESLEFPSRKESFVIKSTAKPGF